MYWLMWLLTTFLLILSIFVLFPTLILFVEVIAAALFSRQQRTTKQDALPSHAILIPAHNEAPVIADTLDALLPHLTLTTRTIVIADNCTDATADIARQFSVEVLERTNAEQRGKGFALDYGLRFLDANPPEIVVMLDADCTVEDGGIAAIVQQAQATQSPVQAIYLQHPPQHPSKNDLVSAFAFRVKNWIRPKGLHNLSQPCLLTGTGMAFPFGIIRNAPLASGNIVEDMQLGLDLAIAGSAPQLVSEAIVWGELPDKQSAATTQRTRWEHGHLNTLLTQVPRLLKEAIKQRRFGLFALACELSVPPLALLVLIWIATCTISLLFGMIAGSWVPTLVLGIAGLLLFVAIGGAWMMVGRKILPLSTLLSIPFYIVWKIPLYLGFLFKRQTDWVRTARNQVTVERQDAVK